jgi:hypothetical protein
MGRHLGVELAGCCETGQHRLLQQQHSTPISYIRRRDSALRYLKKERNEKQKCGTPKGRAGLSKQEALAAT